MRCFEDIRAIYRSEGPVGRAVMVAMLVSAVIYGGSKPGLRSLPPPNEEVTIANAQFTVAERTLGLACVTNPVAIAGLGFRDSGLAVFESTSNAVAKASWLATGVYDDYFTLTPSADAPISIGTNEVRRLMVFSHGFVRAMLESGAVMSLEPFHAPMSFIAQSKWAEYGVTSRCWTASSPESTIIAWENALLNRDTALPLSFQMEFLASGDLVCRYGDSAAINSRTNATISLGSLSSPPWENNSLSLTGTIARASSLHFANIAAYGDGTGDADNDGLSDYEELMLHGTNPNEADTDGDGLADLSEVNGGTNPFDPDEDNDGVADGISTNALAAILAPDASSANLIVAFGSSASTNGSATPPLRGLPPPDRGVLTIDSVPLIIQAGTTLNLNLPTGRTVNFNFVSLNYLGLDVSVSGNGTPVLVDDGEGFFRGGAKLSASGSLLAGSLGIYFADAGVTGPCVHEYPGTRRCRVSLGDDEWGRWKPFATITGENADTETLTLHVADDPTSEASLQIYFPATMMLVGGLEASISMHRCEAGHGGHQYCQRCGDAIPHGEGLSISPHRAVLGVSTDDFATFSVSGDSYVQNPSWSLSPQVAGGPALAADGDTATVHAGTVTGVYTLTASGEGVSDSATVIVYGVDYLTIESDAFPDNQEIVHFPGMTPHPFDVTHSPVPDLHQPFFYKDAQTNFVVNPFSVNLIAHMTPDCVTDEDVSCEWNLDSYDVDGTFEDATCLVAHFAPTSGGGVYPFTFSCGSVSNSETVLVLPLSGA